MTTPDFRRPTPTPGRLLVVEHNDTTRQRMAGLLRRRGFEVVEAVDGQDALRKVVAHRFTGIVLDLVLPHLDGWQFRATQMRHPELARIPTVVVTVQPLREPARYALRAENVVHKPFEDEVLLEVVERACRITPDGAEAAGGRLLWSRRGEVACAAHAPDIGSQRWHDEHWAVIPRHAKRTILYQCQHCSGSAVGHRKRGTADEALRSSTDRCTRECADLDLPS